MNALLIRNRLRSSLSLSILGGVTLLLLCLPVVAQKIDGFWDATVTVDGVSVPFRIELSTKGSDAGSYFFNGEDRANPSTYGKFQDGNLILRFASYATELDATLKDGVLTGSFHLASGTSYPFQARRYEDSSDAGDGSHAPDIDGLWEIQVMSPKGESAWRFLVRQAGTKVSASILRVDGDTGTLSGEYRNGKFVLSHFTGERPFYVEVTSLPDETLTVDILSSHDRQTLIALRPQVARAKALVAPEDPTQHTKLKNPNEPLHFSFPDLNGQLISDGDARFGGKVVLVNITGSWCPNCHDEAPFLQELYSKYHAQGLEIVALDFEPVDQLKELTRVRAFIQRYGIQYLYLIAGEPGQLNEKVPQAENLNAWPTTFFVGRDGLVHEIHTGFTSRASGEFDSQLKSEITKSVVHLLAEAPATATNSETSIK